MSRLLPEARLSRPVERRGTCAVVATVQYDKVRMLRTLLSDPRLQVNDVVTTSGGHTLLHWAVMSGNCGAISIIAEVEGEN